jgi:hypothetical protein
LEVRMVHISLIQSQLTKLDVRLSRWFKPEIKELQHILMEKESIVACAAGRYYSGFALLVATDLRLLLIDKRTFFMTVEDIRYDMISEIDYSSRLYDSTIHIFSLNKQHDFTSIKYKHQLRALTTYVQQRVWELRQYQEQAPLAPPVVAAAQPQPSTPQPENSPPLATGTISTLHHHHIPESLHVPHLHRPQKPQLPKHIGLAALNGSRRFTPNVYTTHLTRNRPIDFASATD